MIDLHTHVLPGLDDGVATLDEAVALARSAAAEGIRALVATPHVRDDYPTTAEAIERGVAELRARLAAEHVDVEVHPGAEVAYDFLPRLDEAALRRLTLAGSRYLLVELPDHGWPLGLERTLFELQVSGLTPVIAHAERNAVLRADPAGRLEPLLRSGTLVQVTAAAVDGRLGRGARKAALRLVELRLAHLLASDAHDPSVRAVGLAAACAELGDEALARYLTEEAPAAVLADRPLPAPPPARRRRRFGLL